MATPEQLAANGTLEELALALHLKIQAAGPQVKLKAYNRLAAYGRRGRERLRKQDELAAYFGATELQGFINATLPEESIAEPTE